MLESLKPLNKRVAEDRKRLVMLSHRASSIAAEADKICQCTKPQVTLAQQSGNGLKGP